MPNVISLISFLCHQLIICACQGSDILVSLHVVGKRRLDDNTVADSADLAGGQWYELHSHQPFFVPEGTGLIVCIVKHSNI